MTCNLSWWKASKDRQTIIKKYKHTSKHRERSQSLISIHAVINPSHIHAYYRSGDKIFTWFSLFKKTYSTKTFRSLQFTGEYEAETQILYLKYFNRGSTTTIIDYDGTSLLEQITKKYFITEYIIGVLNRCTTKGIENLFIFFKFGLVRLGISKRISSFLVQLCYTYSPLSKPGN